MKFQIKSQFSAKILFELDCNSLKICIEKAIGGGAGLHGADLRGADLYGADNKKIKLTKNPIQILGLHWPILIFNFNMRIGCEFHLIEEWENFTPAQIKIMDKNALKFWNENKEALLTICKQFKTKEGK